MPAAPEDDSRGQAGREVGQRLFRVRRGRGAILKRKRPPAGDPPLPVDVERLRRQFPALTAEDLDGYVTVTRRILSAAVADRARVTREMMARARAARAASPRDDDDRLALRYLNAVEKMQGR